MTSADSNVVYSSRRRPSLRLKARPRTAVPCDNLTWNAMGLRAAASPSHQTRLSRDLNIFHQDTNDAFDQYRGVEDDEYSEQVLEETHLFPEPVRKHRSARSFSSLRHGVDGLRALGRRLSFTIRRKSSKHILHVHQGQPCLDESSAKYQVSAGNLDGKSENSWADGNGVNRRLSLHSVSALQDFYASASHTTHSIPRNGLEPPILRDGFCGGASARAAAAAQNELAKIERVTSKSEPSIYDLRLTRDSESGIGIDIRDRSEISEDETAVVRIDPVRYLPAEITAQILSYLDPESLMQAEIVSRFWNEEASSHHVWRIVFRREFGHNTGGGMSTKRKTQPMGLGKTRPNQDWKQMFFVRQALEHRWKEGRAAAIYLQGHKDSVYCVQFDENKIITGSRDRTIRIWDAHYPWPCLKVIGAPPNSDDDRGATMVTNPTPQSLGRSPFLTICPPSRPPVSIVTPVENISDYHQASILCLQFDDEIMVTGSSDFTCIVWDVRNDYSPIRRLVSHKSSVLDVCFDDRYIVSCSKDTTICVWDRLTGELVKKLIGHRGPVNAVQLRGDLVVSASGDGVAKLWNISSGLCIKEFLGKDRGFACVEFSEDARMIFTGGNDKVIYQFDANTGELVKELKGHAGLVRSLHLDDLNNRVVSGSYDMSVKVFNAAAGELVIDLPGWTTSWMLSAKSDYRRIVAASQDSCAVIMDFGFGLDGIELLEG